MVLDEFPQFRAPSSVVYDPASWKSKALSDLEEAVRSRASTARPEGPSFQDNLTSTLGDWFNQTYGAPNDTQNASDRGALWSGAYNTAEAAFDPNYYNSFHPETGDVDPTKGNSGYIDSAKSWFGQDTADKISGYQQFQGFMPDFTNLDAQRTQIDKRYQDMLSQQQNVQGSYAKMRGGGTPGGVMTNSLSFGPSFGSLDGSGFGAGNTSDPDTALAPWNTPGYNPQGAGGLGGYNPNPWNTAGPNSRAQSPFGGAYSNRNPFAMTG
jgi:hypothetical protein